MKYRQSELLAAKSITTAGTEILDINVREPISRLMVIVKLTNSSHTPTGHPASSIVKIEVVDGSNVLHSMRGTYSAAMAFYGTKVQPWMYLGYADNATCNACIPVYFGRRLWDRELALDPKRFNNLQLKITHNYALGGSVPDAATLEVWGDLFDDDPPSPSGFLSAKSIWSKTFVDAATDYVEIPTDAPVRLLCPALYSIVEEPNVDLDNFKISEDHDRKTIIEANTLAWLRQHEYNWPEWHEMMEARPTINVAMTAFFSPQKNVIMNIIPSSDNDGYLTTTWSGGGIRVFNAAATMSVIADVHGRCPFGVIPVAMGELNEIDSWWDVTKLGNARIKMVAGTGDDAALFELLIQQLRRY